jgi:uncharacterized protein (DUF433 family)
VPGRALTQGGAERLRESYPSLTPDLIQEALDFYDGHQAEIDQLIRENEADLD